VLLSAEFHTLGTPKAEGERELDQLPEQPEAESYKAMVMVYLNGGADTFNLIVPLCSDLYSEYQQVRQDIALPRSSLSQVSAPTQNCAQFGVHHKLPFVKQLYDDGQLAFVSNVGSLVEPTTKQDYEAKEKCSGLYSHADQTNGAQTLKCQVQGSSPKGFGGRLADFLGSAGHFSTSFSLSGVATWSQGFETSVEIVSGSSGVVQLDRYAELRSVVGNATKIKYGNQYSDEYVRQLEAAVLSSERLGMHVDQVTLTTDYVAETELAKQLRQVAKLMATRDVRKAERDFFYVSIGGFDTHDDTNEVLDEKFTEIDDALAGFVAELVGQSVFDQTVIVTSSEFGRTLTSNGAGTDHAWAGNHFVLGGAISGGKIFNDFPSSLLEGNEQDAGRGRLIPKYPWESMMVPVAEWMGGDPNSDGFARVFPNLQNFDRAQYIIGTGDMFASSRRLRR
jgi:cullin-associated NEDD8-dissociated protein 1